MENEKEIYGKSCGEIALEDWRYTVRERTDGKKLTVIERGEPVIFNKADYLPLFSQRQAEMRRAANRLCPPRWHRWLKRACLFTLALLLSTIFFYACVDAAVRESEINEAIRKDRCLHQNLSAEVKAGYCKGI